MFDLRYHIASLMAVFLALGLGILVGITIVDDEALVNEQKYLIDRLEEDFRHLRGQNTLLRQEIAKQRQEAAVLEEFARAALPYVIRDQLAGKRIAIVQSTGHPLPEGLAESLSAAGAEVVSSVNVAALLEEGSRPGEALADPEAGTGPLVTAGPAGGTVELIWSGLTGSGPGPSALDAVIILGGTNVKEKMLFEELDLPLISLLKEKGIVVAGVEVSGMPYSYLPYFRKWADITVERVETVYGQAALVFALSGFPGSYGPSGEAVSLLPPRRE